MKTLIFLLCLILMGLIVAANLSCTKERATNCGTVWDKGKNQSGRYELTVDDRTIGVDSITWVNVVVGSQYCQ